MRLRLPARARHVAFFLVGAGALAGRLRLAQADPSVRYRDYSRCLPDYLRMLAERAYGLRNTEIARLTTASEIRERQRWVTRIFWELAGGMPERTPLNARTVGSFEREGYRLEKVVYESQPNFHVSANLYIPTRGRPPFPGVLVHVIPRRRKDGLRGFFWPRLHYRDEDEMAAIAAKIAAAITR